MSLEDRAADGRATLRSRVMVLDGLGVIFRSADQVSELLVPFVRERGCSQPEAAIREAYVSCSLGENSSRELWRSLDLAGHGEDLDAEYVRRRGLNNGIKHFLRRMQALGMPVACLSNDVAEWSARSRRLHQLEQDIRYWVISAEIGCRKPDRRAFEHVARIVGRSYDHFVLVDDRTTNLDAARDVGFSTALFSSSGTEEPSRYPVVRSFAELAQWAEST
jgi:putative hydrolase of the HAD superfamily